MKIEQSVILELLRHGPPHNQLLSPLTRYIALSGCHESVTIQVPFEHHEFFTLLKYLQYETGDQSMRHTRLKQLGDVMSNIFAGVPGLIGDLRRNNEAEVGVTHLRLIFSAAELAMLPFELAVAPNGYPGEGSPISLQLDTPIVMTREVRGADGHALRWDDRPPKILFAAAAPRNSVPLDAHLLALRQALDPWLDGFPRGMSHTERLGQYLTVLPEASISAIQEACSRESYTHVHILAHGAPCENRHGTRYGLRFFGGPGGKPDEVVDGKCLAQALRSHRREIGDGLSRPLVVTVASCDSGLQGSVIWPGASLAQDLHETGIPLVVASQFPLSKKGSTCLVKELYRSLLWGRDPRVCLHEARQKLFTQVPEAHDWASLVAYASLPADLGSQLKRLRTFQAQEAMKCALAKATHIKEKVAGEDYMIPGGQLCREQMAVQLEGEKKQAELHKAVKALDRAIVWMPEADNNCEQGLRLEVHKTGERIAILGSAAKRLAQIMASAGKELQERMVNLSEPDKLQACRELKLYQERENKALDDAVKYYRRALELDRKSHWALVQYLGVDAFVQVRRRGSFDLDMDLWCQARAAAERDLHEADSSKRAWGWASFAELYFLALRLEHEVHSSPRIDEYLHWLGAGELGPESSLAQGCAEKLIEEVGPQSFEAQATYWQFKRYSNWQILSKFHQDIAAGVVNMFKARESSR